MSEPTGNRPLIERMPLLVPRPVRTDVDLRSRLDPKDVPVREAVCSTVPPGGYGLTVSDDGVGLSFADEAGRRAARATLGQLAVQYGASFPRVQIEDHPALPGRGVMLDVSRTRVPRNQELRLFVEQMAGLKLNHLQLYTEHAFAYKGAEAIWGGTDPISPDEARALDDHAHVHGVELVPNQNCFGHLGRWLRNDAFTHLAETQGDWSFLGMPRRGPFSLCPTDGGSIGFVEGLLGQLLPCFRATQVNIGCDETYDVGQGRSAAAVADQGKGEVYGRFVAQICRFVVENGHRPMMWGDIANEHPGVVGLLPPETVGMVWGYEPTSDFADLGRVWRESGRAWWACPGTSSWRSFTGRSAERQANVRRAVREGVSGGAQGVLVTDWGDVGHPQMWPVAMLGIAETADAAWTGADRHPDFLDAVSLQVFGDRSLKTARWIEALGDTDKPLRDTSGVRADPNTPAALANATAMFTELHTPPMPLHLPEALPFWVETRGRVLELLLAIPHGAGPLVQSELQHAAQCALFACDVAIYRRQPATEDPRIVRRLRERLGELIAEHRERWLVRSREGGLDESVKFWETIEIDRPSKG